MPLAPPPAGFGGLPRLSTRVFQLIDSGYNVLNAVWTAFAEYLGLLITLYGQAAVITIEEIK